MNRITRFKPLTFSRSVKTSIVDWKPIVSSTIDVQDAENKTKHKGFRKVLFSLMIAMPIVSFGLGCWQVKRLEWKRSLISKCESELAKAPLDSLPPNISPEAVKDFEFRRFKIKGSFDYSQEMFLGPRMKDGMTGYLLVTPFIRSDGGKPILVERGWISKEKVIPSARQGSYLDHLAMPQGEIEIEAFFRVMPERSSLQYEHENGSRLFFIPDVEAMAEQSGALPVYCQMIYDLGDHPEFKQKKLWTWFNKEDKEVKIDDFELQHQEFEFVKNGVPVAKIPKVNFTNNHLQYLVTWFGVSLASSCLLIYNLYKTRKLFSAEQMLKAKRDNMKRNW